MDAASPAAFLGDLVVCRNSDGADANQPRVAGMPPAISVIAELRHELERLEHQHDLEQDQARIT